MCLSAERPPAPGGGCVRARSVGFSFLSSFFYAFPCFFWHRSRSRDRDREAAPKQVGFPLFRHFVEETLRLITELYYITDLSASHSTQKGRPFPSKFAFILFNQIVEFSRNRQSFDASGPMRFARTRIMLLPGPNDQAIRHSLSAIRRKIAYYLQLVQTNKESGPSFSPVKHGLATSKEKNEYRFHILGLSNILWRSTCWIGSSSSREVTSLQS